MSTVIVSRFNTGLLYFLAIGVALYAGFAYLPLETWQGVGSDINDKPVAVAHSFGIYTHILASIFALALGPFQFSASLRKRNINLHRWMGRAYLGVGVLAGGIGGLYSAQYAFGGLTAKLGFSSLAVIWLYTGYMAYSSIRRGKILEHRKWMLRNFALTFAAVTLRLYLPLSAISSIPFEVAYPIISWLAWVPNMVYAEWWIKRTLSNSAIQKESRVPKPA